MGNFNSILAFMFLSLGLSIFCNAETHNWERARVLFANDTSVVNATRQALSAGYTERVSHLDQEKYVRQEKCRLVDHAISCDHVFYFSHMYRNPRNGFFNPIFRIVTVGGSTDKVETTSQNQPPLVIVKGKAAKSIYYSVNLPEEVIEELGPALHTKVTNGFKCKKIRSIFKSTYECEVHSEAKAENLFDLLLVEKRSSGSFDENGHGEIIREKVAGSLKCKLYELSNKKGKLNHYTCQIGTLQVSHNKFNPPYNHGICDRHREVVNAMVYSAEKRSCKELRESDLAAIRRLNLYNKGINALEARDLRGLHRLEWIILTANKIADLPSDLFSGLDQLKRIDLAHNQISQFHLAPLPSLEILDIRENQLTSLHRNQLAGFPRLVRLDLSNNKISYVAANGFHSTPHLKVLNVSGNLIEEFDPSLLAHAGKIENFFANNNRLRKLPVKLFSHSPSLQLVYLHQNRLQEIPAGAFKKLQQLQWLSLGLNSISLLESEVLSNLTNLIELDLRQSEIEVIEAGAFKDLRRLKKINLSDNRLASLPDDLFASLALLERVDLDRNQLSTLPGQFFLMSSNLKYLDLSRNKLSWLSAEVFKGLKLLKFLALSNNYLEDISDDHFSDLPKDGRILLD